MGAVDILLTVNRLFKVPEHPFNLQNEGTKTYSQWQYEMGKVTIAYYLKKATIEEMFRDKVVLDIGCGAAGKTMYFASQGVSHIYGMDVVDHYKEDAEAFAKEVGQEDKFTFVLGDAQKAPFPDHSIDTIVMNDAMEHVADPQQVLRECYRILKPKGRLYVNFPPFNHPYGAHLKDVIGIPWVHLFFSDKTMIEGYKRLVSPLPDRDMRIRFRIGRRENGEEYFSYLNKISIQRFHEYLKNTDFSVYYYNEVPVRPYVALLAKLPYVKEFFTKMVVCILEKGDDSKQIKN